MVTSYSLGPPGWWVRTTSCFIIAFQVCCSAGQGQSMVDTLWNSNWDISTLNNKVPNASMEYFLFNPQAYNATVIQNRPLFAYKKSLFGVGIGSEVVFNSNASFVPRQQAFRPVQGMPLYPQFIPVAVRPGLSIFNTKNNAATLLQWGNLMEGRQGFTGGQMQVGKMWRIK